MRWASLLMAGAVVCFVGCQQEVKVTGPGGQEVEVQFPSDVSITQGETEEFKVEVDREKFKDAIKVDITGLPEGVTVEETDMEIPTGVEEKTFRLKAAADAAPKDDHPAQLKVTAGEKDAKPREFKVDVKAKE